MNANLKRIAIALAFVSFGTVGLTTTGQAKTKWHRDLPNALKGDWVTKKGKQLLHGKGSYPIYAIRIHKNDIEELMNKSELKEKYEDRVDISSDFVYYYHHKKGSKYYYVRSPQWHDEVNYGTDYTRFKLNGKKLSVNMYGQAKIKIPANGKKVHSRGTFKKSVTPVTTWYKK